MPGDGITDAAPIAQSQLQALPPPAPSPTGLYLYASASPGPESWGMPTSLDPGVAQNFAAPLAQSQSQMLLSRSAPLDVRTQVAPFPSEGWAYRPIIDPAIKVGMPPMAAQAQQQFLLAKPPPLPLHYGTWSPEDGWLYTTTRPVVFPQMAAIQAQSEHRTLLAKAPQLTMLHTAWQPQDGWMVPQEVAAGLIPLFPASLAQIQSAMLLAPPPVLNLWYPPWGAQEGWVALSGIIPADGGGKAAAPSVQQTFAAMVMQLGSQFALPHQAPLDGRLLLASTTDSGWLSSFVKSLIAPYTTAFWPAVLAQTQQDFTGSMWHRQGGLPNTPNSHAKQFYTTLQDVSLWNMASIITPLVGLNLTPTPAPRVVVLSLGSTVPWSLKQLLDRVNLKLGEQNLFYPGPEILRAGLNPAQRLLCLAYPQLLEQRLALVLSPQQPFVDLREVSRRLRRLRRVVLGDITGDAPIFTANTGEYRDLTPTTVGRLASQEGWFAQQGELRNYWLWGHYWLGVYKRPFDTFTLTLIFEAVPTPLDITTPGQIPDLAPVWHPVIADIATGLLLPKEGDPQAGRGLTMIKDALHIKEQGATPTIRRAPGIETKP